MRLTVKAIALSERPTPFRHPFRFGAVTVNAAPQLFVHADVEIGGKIVTGTSAELMVPKWFNKDPDLSADDTVAQLRRSVELARELYLGAAAGTAFVLSASCYAKQIELCGREGIPALAAAFGAAEIDKAILDALLRSQSTNFFQGLNDNLPGIDARLTPDLDAKAIERFLRRGAPPGGISIRYTIGMLDTEASMREAAEEGYRYYKLKLCGDPIKDRGRLIEIACALKGVDYKATADANEQYRSLADLAALVETLENDPALADLGQRILYIEQPFARENTWNFPLGDLARRVPFIIDEADDSYDAFPRAKALGYRGVSSKSCKGLYKSLLNGARAAAWGEGYFVTAEDLTCQAGLAVQQDTALVAFHGLTHAERNGHHYVPGFAETPPAEAEAFAAAHPDLYERADGAIRLIVRDGTISTFSLAGPGFACGVSRDRIGPAPAHQSTVKELAS